MRKQINFDASEEGHEISAVLAARMVEAKYSKNQIKIAHELLDVLFKAKPGKWVECLNVLECANEIFSMYVKLRYALTESEGK